MHKAPMVTGTSRIPSAAPAGGAACAVFDETACLVGAPLPPAGESPVGAGSSVPDGDGKPDDEANDNDCRVD